MTTGALERRKFDASRAARRFRTLPSLLLLTMWTSVLAADPGMWMPTADIERTASAFVERKLSTVSGNTAVIPAKLDARLRLARCSKPLEAFLRPGSEIRERTTIGVRCSGEKPWKVYVPVDLVVTETVYTTRRSLSRGHLLTEADLVAVQRDVSKLRRGYFTVRARLIGQKARQSLVAGQIITPGMIEADTLIRRGQSVTLSVASERLSIRMSGKALSDGALHQRIRVENTNSGRVVEGIVRSREHVEVLVAGTDGIF